ncbi:MAG TPA: hypothetical protein PLK48_06105, partial [Caldisericia bacterium]|nr:hypothetical protein [Caldisericia bacterium]
MKNNKIQQTTFWKFLQNRKIVIPIIQRDYAQGRIGKEKLREKFLGDLKNALDKKLLEEFLNDFKKALEKKKAFAENKKITFARLKGKKIVLVNDLKHENEKLKLDFVYGNIENNCFNPLDGQQRLT